MSGEPLSKFCFGGILMCGNNCFGGNNCWWIIILVLLFCCGGCGNGNGGYNTGCGCDRC